MTGKPLHLLLAPKERFEADGAGAFALNVLETSRASRFRERITVFGSPVARPYDDIRFQPVDKAHWWEGDRNKAMARQYVRFMRAETPAFVEVYNRPVVAATIGRRFGDIPVMLHLGNDPRSMDGSRTPAERARLLERCSAVVCVSDFIRRCFLDGLVRRRAESVYVLHTGVRRPPELPPKENHIVYVGRVVPEKGVLELVQALARVLPAHPEWKAEIIGARWFGGGEKPTTYEKTVGQAASACHRITLSGFRPHEEVLASLARASIAVVPSRWDDPFPRSALEALAHGCALIASTRGGLPELGRERALFVEAVSADALADALERLVTGDNEREALQRRARDDFPFDVAQTTAALDDLREKLMSPA